MILNSALSGLFSLFLPHNCLMCGYPVSTGHKIICPACFDGLPRLDRKLIRYLLEEIPDIHFRHVYIPFQFSPAFQKVIHAFKYQRLLKLAAYFGRELAGCIDPGRYDGVTAVPLHKIRYRERGFNQSEAIARDLARYAELPYYGNALRRTKNNPSQTRLNRSDRLKNVQDIFSVGMDVSGLTLLVVDDVITTGSTLNACCRVLSERGASEVDAAALATPVTCLEEHKQRDKSKSNRFQKIP